MVKRSIPVSIILSLITCGIYGLYWISTLTDDANELSGRTNETTGGMTVLFCIITCGIYGYYWAYKMGEKLDAAKAARGMPTSYGPILYLVLQFFIAIVGWALMQDEINKLIDARQ